MVEPEGIVVKYARSGSSRSSSSVVTVVALEISHSGSSDGTSRCTSTSGSRSSGGCGGSSEW